MDQPAASISAVHVSSLSERTAHKVSYAPDLLDQSGDDDTIKASSGKGSRAGSMYYSGSENGGQSQSVSVYQSVDLDDSDAEFELEVEDEAKPAAGVSDKADGALNSFCKERKHFDVVQRKQKAAYCQPIVASSTKGSLKVRLLDQLAAILFHAAILCKLSYVAARHLCT